MGDFNVAPEFLEESGFLGLVRARTVAQDNVAFTCDVGETMIDYVVRSESAHSSVKVSADARCPFRAHACLDVAPLFDALSTPVCQRRTPLKFPEIVGPDNVWLSCVAEASSTLLPQDMQIPDDIIAAMPQHTVEDLPPQLGRKYLVWSRAVELMLLSRANALVDEPHQYFGRGTTLQRRM
eukprot:4487891-Pyramimonas_sp.AAC.1